MVPRCTKYKMAELKGDRRDGNVNTSLSIIDRIIRKNISKEIEDLNRTINRLSLIYMCTKFHLNTAEYRFFSNTLASINLKTEIIQNILSK